MELRVAVVTPYYREPIEYLRQCHESVAAQTYPVAHFMVADGNPRDDIARWKIEHIPLSRNHADFGDTPRAIGALSALALEYDAITFLDADNWFHRKHIEVMVGALKQTRRSVGVASRKIHRRDGSFMYDASDGGHVDMNCIFLTGESTRLIPLLALKPKALATIDDRIFWNGIVARNIPFVHVATPTVHYRTNYKVHYLAGGETPPDGSREAHGEAAYNWLETATAEEKASWGRFLFGGDDRWMSITEPM